MPRGGRKGPRKFFATPGMLDNVDPNAAELTDFKYLKGGKLVDQVRNHIHGAVGEPVLLQHLVNYFRQHPPNDTQAYINEIMLMSVNENGGTCAPGNQSGLYLNRGFNRMGFNQMVMIVANCGALPQNSPLHIPNVPADLVPKAVCGWNERLPERPVFNLANDHKVCGDPSDLLPGVHSAKARPFRRCGCITDQATCVGDGECRYSHGKCMPKFDQSEFLAAGARTVSGNLEFHIQDPNSNLYQQVYDENDAPIGWMLMTVAPPNDDDDDDDDQQDDQNNGPNNDDDDDQYNGPNNDDDDEEDDGEPVQLEKRTRYKRKSKSIAQKSLQSGHRRSPRKKVATKKRPSQSTATKKRPSQSAAKKKRASEAAKKKRASEAAKKKRASEAAKKKRASEAAKKKRASEAAKKKRASEAVKKKRASEAVKKKRASEAVKKKRATPKKKRGTPRSQSRPPTQKQPSRRSKTGR